MQEIIELTKDTLITKLSFSNGVGSEKGYCEVIIPSIIFNKYKDSICRMEITIYKLEGELLLGAEFWQSENRTAVLETYRELTLEELIDGEPLVDFDKVIDEDVHVDLEELMTKDVKELELNALLWVVKFLKSSEYKKEQSIFFNNID